MTHTLEQTYGATHRLLPPGCCNTNADGESVHATLETEFYDLEHFGDCREFLAKAATYQLWYNVRRQNRSRGWKIPLDLLEEKAPSLNTRILLLHPLGLPTLLPNLTRLPKQVAHPVPVHPARQIHEWAYRNRPLAEEQKESNWQKLKIRARIAHVFGYRSQSMKGFYLRYIGRRRHAPLPDARFHPTHP